MKNLVIFFLLLFAFNSANTQEGNTSNQFVAPDLYKLSGGHLRISYSTTSINGQPNFRYQDGSQSLTFNGSEIRQTTTEIGTLVTVTTRRTVDTGSTSFTLLIPAVNVTSQSPSAEIHTIGIATVHRFSVITAMNHAQVESYTSTALSGTASRVLF